MGAIVDYARTKAGLSVDKEAVLAAMQGRWLSFYEPFTTLHKTGPHDYRGPCPIHGGDGDRGFSVNPDTGEWYCFSNCEDGGDALNFLQRMGAPDFVTALEQLAQFAGVWAEGAPMQAPRRTKPVAQNTAKRPLGPVVATYDYTDEQGVLLFQVTRHDPKDFRQRRPDGGGGWLTHLGDVRRVLYRLPDVLAAVHAGKPVFVVEGEKDADGLSALGLTATCNAGGADKTGEPESGKWTAAMTETLCGAGVVILPDNDKGGRTHGQTVAARLHGTARRVRVVELPGLPEKGDVSDWIAAGGTKAGLLALVKAAPDFSPQSVPAPETEIEPASSSSVQWPAPLNEAAYHGLAGEVVRAIEPHTEADPAAVLVQLLVAAGNLFGRSAYFGIGADRHHTNLFCVIVGKTAAGRKGTSWSETRAIVGEADPTWRDKCISGGLSSGEGLIAAVRDPVEKQEPIKEKGKITGYQAVVTDEGVEDKRLLIVEGEFASVLKQAEREGNILSAVIRNAWDSGDLHVMTKTRQRATDAQVSIIGHITAEELKRQLTSTEAANGFANRFLWVCAKRSKILPFPSRPDAAHMEGLSRRLSEARGFADKAGAVQRNAKADRVWGEVYADLTRETPGLLGSIIPRAAPIVMRLSLIYAMLDCAPVIRQEHLLAALAVWEYADASCRFIFGDSLGDPLADDILRYLRSAGPDGMTRTDLNNKFQRHRDAARLDGALRLLQEYGRVVQEKQDTGGRPAEVFRIQ